jgi:hypothetical protein
MVNYGDFTIIMIDMMSRNNGKNNNSIRKLLFRCYYCKLEFDNEEEYLIHVANNHPEEPRQPNIGLINVMREKWGRTDIEPKGNPWE